MTRKTDEEIMEERENYECSCGEKFTYKLNFIKHKNKCLEKEDEKFV